jgi:hypothetical protein
MKQLFFIALSVLSFVHRAEAGCGAPLVEEYVSGKTYTANDHPQYPTMMTLYSGYEHSAALGSLVDGHPGGTYRWKALCYGGVALTFYPSIGSGSSPDRTIHFSCAVGDCSVLKDNASGTIFTQVKGK